MNDDELTRQLETLRRDQRSAPDFLATRIIANLPAKTSLDWIFDWLGRSVWRGLAASLLPLILGFGLAVVDPTDEDAWYEAERMVFVDSLEEYLADEL